MSQDSSISTRIALSKDAKAVRMLLSSAFDAFEHILVAESELPLRIVAAGALTRSMRPKPLKGPGVTLQVIETFRGKGIGKTLLEGLAARALKRGAEAIYATQKVDATSEAMRAWSALGFSPCETVEHHELPLDQFEPQLAPLYDRMLQRGKIPAAARIIPLFDADPAEVLRLHLATLGGDATALMQKLRGEVHGSYMPRLSRVLVIDDQVVGFILAHRVSREIAYVDANVVAPEVRGSWANVWLKLEATREAMRWGINQFVFTSFDHYKDTRSFTERMRGATVQKSILMHLPLAPSQGSVSGGG
ncbi:MAG: GNAT family N-acetyltransferase [Bythopirellula sp.]|nr:GNAT family N-acetyltransferase [Bythopirellula sp.]